MKIKSSTDCKNSPKKELLKKLTVLFASYKVDEVEVYFAEDIEWRLVGDKPIVGKAAFASALREMSGNRATELIIHSIVTNEKDGAIHGEMLMENGDRFGFSDFYKFTSASAKEVKSITSYVLQIK